MSFFKPENIGLKVFSILLISLGMVFIFQNCAKQPEVCNSINSGSASGADSKITSNCSTNSDLSSLSADKESSEDADSPFLGTGTSYAIPSGGIISARDYSSISGSSISTGSELVRNCTNDGCPTALGFTFQIIPKSINIEEGKSGNLQAKAVNASGIISYQWYKNGSPISGKTTSNFGFYPLKISDAGSYMVRAYDKNSSGVTLKMIESSVVTVTVVEKIIDCAATTYAWYSKPMEELVYGDISKMDPWNPNGVKLMNPIYSSFPNYVSAPKDENTLIFNLQSKVSEGSLMQISCFSVRKNAPKPANRLGIPSCPEIVYRDYITDTLELRGEVVWKCNNGRFEYINTNCSCVVTSSTDNAPSGGGS